MGHTAAGLVQTHSCVGLQDCVPKGQYTLCKTNCDVWLRAVCAGICRARGWPVWRWRWDCEGEPSTVKTAVHRPCLKDEECCLSFGHCHRMYSHNWHACIVCQATSAAQGPLMLEMGVLPDVAAATSATMM